MKCRGKIVRNDCFMEYPVAFFIVFKEVAHAVLIQTLKVKSLFILTYIFKMLFEPLFWGAANTLEEVPTVHFLPCGLCAIKLILANLSRKVRGKQTEVSLLFYQHLAQPCSSEANLP